MTGADREAAPIRFGDSRNVKRRAGQARPGVSIPEPGFLEGHPNHQLQDSGVSKGPGTRLRQAVETANLGATGAAAALSGIIDCQRSRGVSRRWAGDDAAAVGGKRREGQPAVNTREYGVVEDVECVGAELQVDLSVLDDRKLLLERHVKIQSTRAVEIVDAGFEPDAPNLGGYETRGVQITGPIA